MLINQREEAVKVHLYIKQMENDEARFDVHAISMSDWRLSEW